MRSFLSDWWEAAVLFTPGLFCRFLIEIKEGKTVKELVDVLIQ